MENDSADKQFRKIGKELKIPSFAVSSLNLFEIHGC